MSDSGLSYSVANTTPAGSHDHTSMNETDDGRVERIILIFSYVVPVLFGIIFITGIVGNGTLIYIVMKNKSMWNVPNIYIVSLACGDMLLLLFCVPFHATVFTFDSWPYGAFMCTLSEYVITLSLGVSVFTLTLLSWDRYMAIVDPLSKHKGRPIIRTLSTSITIWIVSALIAIMDAVGTGLLEGASSDVEFCSAYPPEWGTWYRKFRTLLQFFIYFFLPVCIIALFYVLMAKILIKSSKDLPVEGNISDVHLRQIQARKKVAKVVLAFVALFIVCWLPRQLFLVAFHFELVNFDEYWFYFKILGFCFSYINSCINPFALYFLSKQFRYYYNMYLFCCCSGHRYNSLEAETNANNFNSTVRRSSTTMTTFHAQTPC